MKGLLLQTITLKLACIIISSAVRQNYFYSLKQDIESLPGEECVDAGVWASSAAFVQIDIITVYEWILMISTPKLRA